jgi:hypothetical protein
MKILTITLILLCIGGAAFYLTQERNTTEIALYFPLAEENLEPYKNGPVLRTISNTENIPNTVLLMLFAGPIETEKAKGFYSPFTKSVRPNPSGEALGARYNSVYVFEGTAFVDFSPEALLYLNGPAAEQAVISGAIKKTLKALPEVNEVEYTFDGEVFTEWDA